MNMNKKLMTLASAVVLMGASVAHAAPYTVSGGGDTLTLAPAFGGLFPIGTVAAVTVVTGAGEVDTTGGVFNSGTFTTVVSITSPLNAALSQIITTDYVFTDAAGNGTTQVTDCFDAEATEFCDEYTGSVDPIVIANFGFDFSDLSNLTWGTSSITNSVALGGIDLQTDISYSATPSAVPVPAAAWLFGSALVGLAGVGRRRG